MSSTPVTHRDAGQGTARGVVDGSRLDGRRLPFLSDGNRASGKGTARQPSKRPARARCAADAQDTKCVGALLLCWLLTGRPEATVQEPQPGVGRGATSCRTWRSGRGDVQTRWRAAGAPSTTIRVTASAARDPETGSNTNLSRMIFGGSKDRSTTVLARARRFTEGIFLLRV